MARENTPSYSDNQQQKPSMNPTPADPSKDRDIGVQPKKQPEVWADRKPGSETEIESEEGTELESGSELDPSKGSRKQPM